MAAIKDNDLPGNQAACKRGETVSARRALARLGLLPARQAGPRVLKSESKPQGIRIERCRDGKLEASLTYEASGMSAAIRFSAMIDDELAEGWIVKDGKTFRAYADFRGERIEVRSSSQTSAETKWREKANHRANE